MSMLKLSVKKTIVRYLINSTQPPADFWEYAVSTSWLTNVEADPGPSDRPTNRDKDDSFAFVSSGGGETADMSSIEESEQPVPPVTMSEDDRSNTYLPESHWKILTMWFGVDSKHQLRRRPVNNQYMAIAGQSDRVHCDKELDFIPIWIANMNDLVNDKKQHILSVFVWEDLIHICRQVRAVLEIKGTRKLRFWMRIQEDGHDIVWEPILTPEQSLISKLCSYFPEIGALMNKRQNQINKSFIDGTTVDFLEENFQTRRPLMDEWFGDRIRSVSIGVEEVGLSLLGQKGEDSAMSTTGTTVVDDTDQLESIETLSSIRNEWDDVLSCYIDEYTDLVTRRTSVMRQDLMTAAKEVVGNKLDELSEIRADYQRRFVLLEAREAAMDDKERDFKQRDSDLQSKLQTFKKGLADFQKQKQKWDDDVRKIEEQNIISDSRVTLNIGGYVYTTSMETLKKEPDSLLAVMFSGRHELKQEPDGSYFIDRDGVYFRYVLNYLRDGIRTVEAMPEDKKLVREVLLEARYYKLSQMEKALIEKLSTECQASYTSHEPSPYMSV